MNEPLVSVIILNWNGEKVIRECIDSVLRTDYSRFEVIVVDNASSDSSKDIIRSLYPHVKLIEEEKNLGWCMGNNVGIKEAKGDIIVLLNNDTIVDRNWIKEIVKKAVDPKVGIIGCRLYFPRSNVIQSLGFREVFLGNYESIGAGQIDNGQFGDVEDVDYVSGAALAVKREVLEKIGLLDPNLLAFHNDVDICLRAKKAGYRVVTSNAKVYHYGSFSWNQFQVEKKILLSHRDRLYFIVKHYGIRALPRYLLEYTIKSFHYDLSRFIRGGTVAQKLESLKSRGRGKKLYKLAIKTTILNYTMFIVALFGFMFQGRKINKKK